MILFIKMSFFHYNIAKAIFAIILKGTEYGRSEKSTVLRRILRLLYIAIKVYVKFAHLPEGRKSLPCVKGGGLRSKTEGL